MNGGNWTRAEVEAIVDDYLSMLASELAGTPYNKAAHRRALKPLLHNRSDQSIEREARNRSLGAAGERFILNYERARLIHAGREALAAGIEHTSVVRGDHEGYDILSFEESGAERLIEVKTTKYGDQTPFFVTRHEVDTSEQHAGLYHVYRLFSFREVPRLYTLPGAIGTSCRLHAATFLALPR